MKVVSVVVFVVIATSVSFVYSYGCEKAPKTRTHKDKCSSGSLFKVNYRLARAWQIPENSKVCQKHKKELEKANNQCSFFSDLHSTTLVLIHSRLFSAIDDHGREKNMYRPGTM